MNDKNIVKDKENNEYLIIEKDINKNIIKYYKNFPKDMILEEIVDSLILHIENLNEFENKLNINK